MLCVSKCDCILWIETLISGLGSPTSMLREIRFYKGFGSLRWFVSGLIIPSAICSYLWLQPWLLCCFKLSCVESLKFCNEKIGCSCNRSQTSSVRNMCGKPRHSVQQYGVVWCNSSHPRQNGSHFAGDILRSIFVNENDCISIQISLQFVPKGPIDNNPALI